MKIDLEVETSREEDKSQINKIVQDVNKVDIIIITGEPTLSPIIVHGLRQRNKKLRTSFLPSKNFKSSKEIICISFLMI